MSPQKRQVSAKTVLDDIKTGISLKELAEKHQLSKKGLESMLKKLIANGLVEREFIEERIRVETLRYSREVKVPAEPIPPPAERTGSVPSNPAPAGAANPGPSTAVDIDQEADHITPLDEIKRFGVYTVGGLILGVAVTIASFMPVVTVHWWIVLPLAAGTLYLLNYARENSDELESKVALGAIWFVVGILIVRDIRLSRVAASLLDTLSSAPVGFDLFFNLVR